MTSLKHFFCYLLKYIMFENLLILFSRVCNNKDPYEFTDAEINQFEILNVRTVDLDDDESNDEFNENDDVEEIDPKILEEEQEEEEKPQKQSDSAITFGK